MKVNLTIWVLLITTTTTTTIADFHPYDKGPHDILQVHITALFNPALPEEIDVWMPADNGTYVAFYVIGSFGGIMPGNAYNELFAHLASHGVTVIMPWSLSLPLNPEDKVPVFVDVLQWADQHLNDKLHNKGVPQGVMVDLQNLVFGGHSAGAHVIVEYLKHTCGNVKGQVLYSPVDGFDPFGFLPVFCITPGEILNYVIPTLHLSAGLDPLPGSSGYPCAPDDLSNSRFYEAMDPASTPKWSINSTQFGHVDMLDDSYIDIEETTGFCAFNPDLSLEDHAVYRRFVAGQTAAFIKALFTEEEEECAQYLQYLQDTQVMTVQVQAEYSNPENTCPKAACQWHPLTNATIPAS